MSDFVDVLNDRTSAEHFDPTIAIPDSEIRALIQDACQAPSSFNIQHWRFIAVTDQRVKDRLKGATIASNQDRVVAAPLTIIVLGDLAGHKRAAVILEDSVRAKVLPREVADVWVKMTALYDSDPRLARDEAIRSASLAAMTLMLSAGNRGYVTCPIGFNADQVKGMLGISEQYVPVMMITIGRPAPGNTARRPRLSVDQVLAFNGSRDF